jgi:hypothetical protein
MGSKYRWFDFAGSKSYSDDNLDALLADIQGKPAASSPKASSPKTSSNVKGSVGAKKCTKGTSCGAACIQKSDKCLLDLVPGLSPELRKAVNAIGKQISPNTTEDDLEETILRSFTTLDNKQQKAFAEFGELMRQGKVTQEEEQMIANLIVSVTLKPKQDDRGAARAMSYGEIKAIHESGRLVELEKAYKASIKDGVFNPNAPGGMSEYIEKNIKQVEISEKVANLGFNMLPQRARQSIVNSGSVKGEGQVFNGYDAKGNVIFGNTGNEARGTLMVRRWGEQAGLDPFSGFYVDIRAGEPEHLFSWSQAKASGGKGDHPGNLAIAAPQTNNSKAGKGIDDDFGKWGAQIKKWYDMGPDKYRTEVVEPKLAKAAGASDKKERAPSEVERAFSATTPKERVQIILSAAKSYGDRVRYLVIATGAESGQWGQKIPGARAERRLEMDARAEVRIGGKKLKPSSAVLAAAATMDPSQREKFMQQIDQLRVARSPSTQEIAKFSGKDDPKYAARLEELDRQFENSLTKLIEEQAPSLKELL